MLLFDANSKVAGIQTAVSILISLFSLTEAMEVVQDEARVFFKQLLDLQ